MRRALAIVALVAVVGAGVWLLVAAGDEQRGYTVVLDNAFGLTEGADVKAAGVRVGSVADLDVERSSGRAAVDVDIERDDFGRFRQDVFCRVQPQSLIGEYFLNCQPGEADPLPYDATIPVEQTGTTVPPDLVNNIMRRPWRERLAILLSEFGAGFAARGPELDAIIDRALPALRETDEVLRVLSDNRAQLQRLTRDADLVMARLAGNRDDVARFVSEARDTARASANRRVELAETVERLPGFLRELRPALRDLELVADRQTPALRDLRAAAPDLVELFSRLGPFSEAARPAVRSLARASTTGRDVIPDARPVVAEVRRLGRAARDPITNLRFVLEHLDDRDFAVERSPAYGGRRFTGLEAILQYFFLQPQALNLFDQRGYMLKLNVLINECGQYTDAEHAREEPERTRRCSGALGPSAPGITQPDPSPGGARQASAAQPPRPATDAGSSLDAPTDLADYLLGP
jgi:virulence factor Mce-like protein